MGSYVNYKTIEAINEAIAPGAYLAKMYVSGQRVKHIKPGPDDTTIKAVVDSPNGEQIIEVDSDHDFKIRFV